MDSLANGIQALSVLGLLQSLPAIMHKSTPSTEGPALPQVQSWHQGCRKELMSALQNPSLDHRADK